jgi:molybdopterin molybdotransferase
MPAFAGMTMKRMPAESSIQRIAHLTPLRNVAAIVEARVGAVKGRRCPLASAHGRVLAEDVAAKRLPPAPIALRDGYAVEAAAMTDAGPYSPLPLPAKPQRVNAGEPLPSGADAVAPFDAINERGEAVAAVAPGDGALPAGADAAADAPLRRAGGRLRAVDIAALAAAGIADVTVREPRVHLACGSVPTTPLIGAALDMLTHAAAVAGCAVDVSRAAGGLDTAITDESADAVIAVGGTGSGRRDAAVHALAQVGRVEVHGMAIAPGETAAFGFAGSRPVLLVPGRIDAALAVWLLVGRDLVAKLAGGKAEDFATMLPLKRKVASTIGLTELIPVRCAGGMAEPLASGYLSFAALAGSDGWIVVPPDSEGFNAGTPVAVRSWP